MPREFSAGDHNYEYEAIKWREEDKPWNEGSPDDSDLPEIESLLVEIKNIDTGEISYETIHGGMEDWEFVDETLERDWGSEGSRGD